MIRWILDRNWLPIILFSAMITLFSAGAELINNHFFGLFFTSALVIALVLSRKLGLVSIVILPFASYLLASYASLPLLQVFFLALVVFLTSVFGSRLVRRLNIVSALISAALLAWLLGFNGNLIQNLTGSQSVSESVKVNALLIVLTASSFLFLLSASTGRLTYLKIEHIGSPRDQAIQKISGDRLRLEVSKQNERLGIAKDLSELLVQKISAAVSVTEGGVYAIKADPMAADRVLVRALAASRDAQSELRRLYDYLNSSIFSELATFKISDLEALSIAYRELGYNTVIEEQGTSFRLNEGMELCVYKIVFESLQNVRKHAPLGTEISISFLWVEDGLQILIKDNGIELANREKQSIGELVEGYSANDDLDALVTEFDGATLAALRDRAAIYNGRIEATKVPGVGFTLSAIFPHLKSLAGSN